MINVFRIRMWLLSALCRCCQQNHGGRKWTLCIWQRQVVAKYSHLLCWVLQAKIYFNLFLADLISSLVFSLAGAKLFRRVWSTKTNVWDSSELLGFFNRFHHLSKVVADKLILQSVLVKSVDQTNHLLRSFVWKVVVSLLFVEHIYNVVWL